jgi:hypothetical protein
MSSTGPVAVRAEVLRSEALRMRRAGMSCPDIGTALGVTRVRAWQLVVEAMDELRAETLQEAADWRIDLTDEHRENLKRAKELRDNVDPDIAAKGIAQGTAILGKLADLWGANAPTKIAATNPDGTASAVFAVPVAMAMGDWASQAQIVLEQGEEAAKQLTESTSDGSGADNSTTV